MKIRGIYNSILSRPNVWDYYNKLTIIPNIMDIEDCYQFLTKFIDYSEKSKTVLFDNIEYIKRQSPRRLSHIVSAFFLGLWLFHYKGYSFLKHSIKLELEKLNCFQNNNDYIERQFTYIWFMATLFHDLGYPSEERRGGTNMPNNIIPFCGSVPEYYRDVYSDYYTYRKNQEHGIYAGLTFDKDICKIRRFQHDNSDAQLDWKEELEELYHYVSWIILSHNIWMIRDDDPKKAEYENAGLSNLILSSIKTDENLYMDYRIRFKDYPLFSFFCIIDTIEPLKSTSCLSDIDMRLEKKKMIIKSNDSEYCKKVLGLNEWLLPVTWIDDKLTLYLDN